MVFCFISSLRIEQGCYGTNSGTAADDLRMYNIGPSQTLAILSMVPFV